jgi:5-formyltetrahydrofolate cyclo-ligase
MTHPSEQAFNVAQWRKQERARLLDRRRVMTREEHRDASERIMRALLARIPPESHVLIGCYWPFRREFNCVPYMRDVLRCGGRVALPVVIGRRRPLEFRIWTEDAEMERGVWDIPHPASGPPVFPSALVVPLVGFDDRGFRLGYGAGYYDMTLAAFERRPLAVGIGFEFSRLPTIHPQPHDRPMDVIITESGVRETDAISGAGDAGSRNVAAAKGDRS